MQPDQDIALPRRVGPAGAKQAVPFHDADGEPGQVHLSWTQLAGVFGQLTTEDGAPGLPAAVGNARS